MLRVIHKPFNQFKNKTNQKKLIKQFLYLKVLIYICFKFNQINKNYENRN